MKVLIVEDNRTSRECLELLLKSERFWVKACATVIEAKSALAEGTLPDRVVVDYYLPEEDGLEFVKFLRSLSGCENIPVVVTTAADLTLLRPRLLAMPFLKVVQKPFDLETLIQALK